MKLVMLRDELQIAFNILPLILRRTWIQGDSDHGLFKLDCGIFYSSRYSTKVLRGDMATFGRVQPSHSSWTLHLGKVRKYPLENTKANSKSYSDTLGQRHRTQRIQ